MTGDNKESTLSDFMEDCFPCQVTQDPTIGRNIFNTVMSKNIHLISTCMVSENVENSNQSIVKFNINGSFDFKENKLDDCDRLLQ